MDWAATTRDESSIRYGVGLIPKANRADWVAALHAYFDESEDSPACSTYAVAGYVATDKDWENFGVEWSEALVEFGVDPSAFHMSEFEARRPDFAHLNRSDGDRLMERLTTVIVDSAIGGVAVTVSPVSYRAILETRLGIPPPGLRPDWFDPHILCLGGCFDELVLCARDGRIPATSRITCTFDRTDKRRGSIARTHDGYVKHFPDVFSTVMAFGNRREILPLQAADMIAYEAMKEMKQFGRAGGRIPRRKSLRALVATKRLQLVYLTRETISDTTTEILKRAYARRRKADDEI